MLASTLSRGALLAAVATLLVLPGNALGAKQIPSRAADAARPWTKLGLGTSASDRIAGRSSFARHHLRDHLPPVRENIDVVGKLQLSTPAQYRTAENFSPLAEGQIADVAVYKQAAYLNSWGLPEEEDGTCDRGGFFSVDISDPANPKQLAFMPARTDFYHGEGAHVVTFKGRDILAVNNESCGPTDEDDAFGGFELYDVTNPAQPVWLTEDADPVTPGDQMPGDYSTETEDDTGPFMSTDPTPGREFPSSNHSIFMWQDGPRLFAVIVDNVEFHDVDIFDITDPSRPEFITDLDLFALAEEEGFELVDNSAFGNQIFHHDMVVKKIGDVQTMLVSYWDSGYVLLNVNDPTSPTFIRDSDFGTTDPLTGFSPPEGNGHQAEFSHDNKFVLAADEDFSAFRPRFRILTGPRAGEYDSTGVGGGAPPAALPDGVLNGPTVYGGYGCDASDPIPPRSGAGLPPLEPGEEAIVVLQRGPSGDPDNPEGACFPGEKAANAIEAGYDAVLLTNHHAGEAVGIFCGSGGYPPEPPIVTVCTTHEALHFIFGESSSTDVPYPPGHGPPLGDLGEKVQADSVFDGWGYVHLYRNTDGSELEPVDDFAIDEALDERYAQGYGDLSVHEWATDPDVNLGYVAYYAGGMRVFRFGDGGLEETGKFIADAGSNFWGVEVFTTPQGERLFAGSDRDFGLYLFRYTGPGAVKPPAAPGGGAPPPGPAALKETGCENQILGTAGRDLLAGTEGSDTVRAAAGDDVIDARSGGDCLFGDEGKDVIDGEGGNDRLEGATGDDRLIGSVGDDALIGGGGVDRLNGNTGDDRLGGGSKRDILAGGAGRDALYGGAGNDAISGGAGNDRISGGSAADRIYGNAGADRITPGRGRDRVIAAGGNDRINARDGRKDRISCGSGRDRVTADREDVLTSCERVSRR